MIRRTPLRPGKPPVRKTLPKKVNAKRRRRESLRAYGPAARRDWIVAMDCLTCRRHGPSEQSHLRSRAGAGKKGDARHVIPQCGECHALYPQRSKWAQLRPKWTDTELETAAALLDAAWREYQGGEEGE